MTRFVDEVLSLINDSRPTVDVRTVLCESHNQTINIKSSAPSQRYNVSVEHDVGSEDWLERDAMVFDQHDAVNYYEWLMDDGKNIGELIKRGCHFMNSKMKPVRNVGCKDKFAMRPYVLIDISKNLGNVGSIKIPKVDVVINDNEEKDDVEDHILSSYVHHRFAIDETDAPAWVKDLYKQLLTQTFWSVCPSKFEENKVLSNARVLGMCNEWFDAERFYCDIQKVPNYDLANAAHMVADDYSGKRMYRFTGFYYGASVVCGNTAAFLHLDEIKRYEQQEQYGLVQANFRPRGYGTPPPMLLIDDNDVESRVHHSLTVDSIEQFNPKEHGVRLRYALSFGEVE